MGCGDWPSLCIQWSDGLRSHARHLWSLTLSSIAAIGPDVLLFLVLWGQYCLLSARSFDGFGPISPALPHTSLITNEGSAKDGRGRFSSSEESSSEGELSPNDEVRNLAILLGLLI